MGEKKILLADNHKDIVAGVQTLLAEIFSQIDIAADEPSLLKALLKTEPDIIIIDLSFKTAGEKNIIHYLAKRFPDIPYIVLSVHDEQGAINECLDAGAQGVVLKRSLVDDLIPAINAVQEGSVYISPAIDRRNTARKQMATENNS